MEIVVTFMAILELIRLKEIMCIQRRMFDDIIILRNKVNELPVNGNIATNHTSEPDRQVPLEPPA
jgi:chromatin segregation and condensation protein Rec8/ScpA/Scc1 (kleisin family)